MPPILNTTLTINPNAPTLLNPNPTPPIDGGGNNFVELDGAAAGDTIIINLGSGNSTAQIEGAALEPDGAA